MFTHSGSNVHVFHQVVELDLCSSSSVTFEVALTVAERLKSLEEAGARADSQICQLAEHGNFRSILDVNTTSARHNFEHSVCNLSSLHNILPGSCGI